MGKGMSSAGAGAAAGFLSKPRLVIARNEAISPFISVIASAVLSLRAQRGNLAFHFCHREKSPVIASAAWRSRPHFCRREEPPVIAKNHLSLRAQRGNLALHFCHRERIFVIASAAWQSRPHFCHRERSFVIASAAWRSRLSTASK